MAPSSCGPTSVAGAVRRIRRCQQLGDLLLAPIDGVAARPPGIWWWCRTACCTACRSMRSTYRRRHPAGRRRRSRMRRARRSSRRPRARPRPAIERPLIVAPGHRRSAVGRRGGAADRRAVPRARWCSSGADATLDAGATRSATATIALHLATHGVFRADNPTYSALELADGWLSVGELAELSARPESGLPVGVPHRHERRRAGRRAAWADAGGAWGAGSGRWSPASGPPTTIRRLPS